jgi:hypothetical protein
MQVDDIGKLIPSILESSYFQAIQGSSPVRSSVQTFPLSLTIAPLAIMTGAAVAIIGKYNWSNWAGWTMMTTGVGLMALLKVRTFPVNCTT